MGDRRTHGCRILVTPDHRRSLVGRAGDMVGRRDHDDPLYALLGSLGADL